MQKIVSIYISTWNRAEHLKNILNNVAQEAKNLEKYLQIYISDNGSTDNTEKVVKLFKKSSVKRVREFLWEKCAKETLVVYKGISK